MGVLGQNDIWVLAPWSCTKNTIRGRWWLPPSLNHGESYESMFACGSSMHQKWSNYAITNLLSGLCRSVRGIDLLVNLLNPHPGAPARPSIPKVLRTKEHAPVPSPSIIFTFGLSVESINELGGASSPFNQK